MRMPTLLLCCAGLIPCGSYSHAQRISDSGAIRQAQSNLEDADLEDPDLEDPDVQYNLGLKFLNGTGVLKTKDPTTAFVCFQQAAAQGHAEAQYRLGLMYRDGEGVRMDEAKAGEWLHKAAARGNADARDVLDLVNRLKAEARERNKPKTYVPQRNDVQWYASDPDTGKLRRVQHESRGERGPIVLLNPDAMGVLKIGNGAGKAAIGKLIDTFVDRKVCSFVVLPKTALTLEHIPDGRYQLIYVFGDEIIAGMENFWAPSSFTKITAPFEFTTKRAREIDPTDLKLSNMVHFKSYSITLHGVEGGTGKSGPIEPKVFDQY